MLRDSYYVMIGIDDYPGDRQLNNAVGDVERIARILEDKYGFKAAHPSVLNKDATRENIIAVLDGLAGYIGKEDNLIIYFAGHGNKHPTSDAGFWEPVDYNGKPANRIDNSSVLDIIEGIEAKHIILISDSCFSGTLISRNRGGGSVSDHDELDGKKSGYILVSGGMDTVGDGVRGKGSTFNQTICRLLQDNGKPSMAAGELFEEVIRIMNESTPQRPAAVPIARPQIHQGGQMVFRIRESAASAIPEIPIPSAKVENAYLSRKLTRYSDERPAFSFFYEQEVGTVSIDDLIGTQKRIVVLGGAGSGKSIEMIKAAERLKNADNGLVPVHKRLNNYTDGDIERYLPAGWQDIPAARLVLFLDGLDEVPSQFANTALRKISEFSDLYPAATIVISCRNNFYELPSKEYSGTLSGFQVYLLNDIDLGTIRNYVDETGLDGNKFIGQVQSWNYLDLVQKPYFLNILLNYFKEKGDLDIRRSDVLNDALERYFNANREHYKYSGLTLTFKELTALAERIAFVMELMGKNTITDDEIAKIVVRDEEFRALRYLPAFKYDEGKGQWQFEHNNVQEYLASRVLRKQTIEKMIEVLTLSASGVAKIKPTWVNTLSFLVSIADGEEIKELLDWVIENDPEILVRFEPDRLSLETRVTLFKKIFERYQQRQVWVSSNKFSDQELARFGQSDEVIQYLLAILQNPDSTRLDVLNAVHILRKIEIFKFSQYNDQVRTLLLGLLDRTDLNESDQYSIIGALVDLGFNDQELLEVLIGKFGDRENQYLRAGLYKIIRRSGASDRYPDIFLSGMRLNRFNYQSSDRSTVTLMDEMSQLKAGIADLRSPDAIRKLLESVTSDINRVFQFTSDLKDEMPVIIDHIFDAYEKDTSLFPLLATFFARHATESRSSYVPSMLKRIDALGIRWELLQYITTASGFREHEIYSAAASLLNENIVDQLIEQYKKGTVTKETLDHILGNYRWRQTDLPNYGELLAYIRSVLKKHTDLWSDEEPQVDRAEQFRVKAQQNFDILFDKDAFRDKVAEVFDYIEKDVVSHEDLYGYKNGEYIDLHDRFGSAIADIFKEFTYGHDSISKEKLLEWIAESEQFENFRIQTIKYRLSAIPELTVSVEQQKFIEHWVKETPVTNTYTWYFIKKFKIALPEQRYLELTRYFDPSEERDLQQNGFIEQLTTFLPKARINEEVRKNISSNELDPLIRISNAGYALRNGLTDTYNTIITFLTDLEQREHRAEDLLKLWFEKIGDIEKILTLLRQAKHESVTREALRILESSGKVNEHLVEYFREQWQDERLSDNEREGAANRSVRLGDTSGFYFLAGKFLAAPSPDLDLRHFFRHMTELKDPETIDTLMKLLYYAKQPAFKNDIFNDLEPVITETLFNIGTRSSENFQAVKDKLTRFIKENEQHIPHVHFLEFTITKIEDLLNARLSREFSFDDAVALTATLK